MSADGVLNLIWVYVRKAMYYYTNVQAKHETFYWVFSLTAGEDYLVL